MSIPPIIAESMSKNDRALMLLIEQYSKQIDAVIPELVKSFQLHQDSTGKMAQAATSAKFISSLLRQHGGPLTDDIEDFLDGAGRKALESYQVVPGAADFLAVGKREMATVLTANHKELSQSFGTLSKALQDALRKEMISLSLVPKSPDLAAKNIAHVIGSSFGQAKTLVSTAMASTQRDLHRQALDSMPEDRQAYVLYIGPADRKTRPFCGCLEGKAIKKQDLGKLDNGQRGLSDVLRFGGGYNCRHRLLPIAEGFVAQRQIPVATSADIAKANAAATGGR